MVPYYQNRHERQTVGLEGPDLAGQRQRQLLSSARDTALDSIQQFDDITFHVASESRPGSYYEIDFHHGACNCPDFPRIRYCKHLAAISVHFPHLCTQEKPSRDQEFSSTPEPPERIHNPRRSSSPQESLQKYWEDIKSLSHEFDDTIKNLINSDKPDAAVMEAVRSVRYTLRAALASTRGSRALPDKVNIPSNQKTWTETAERMGVKRAPKRRLPDEVGLTDWSIGVAKGKHRRTYEDPYAGGERSGKHAKPDALSAKKARVHVPLRPGSPLGVPFPPGPLSALAPPTVLPFPGPLALASPAPAYPAPHHPLPFPFPPLPAPHHPLHHPFPFPFPPPPYHPLHFHSLPPPAPLSSLPGPAVEGGMAPPRAPPRALAFGDPRPASGMS